MQISQKAGYAIIREAFYHENTLQGNQHTFRLKSSVFYSIMRTVINSQMMFGQIDISAIVFDTKSRDDIPKLLRGLQELYINIELRQRVFAILEEVRPARKNGTGKADMNNGRPGMEQWTILVLGALRLGLNIDYDRLLELVNQHKNIRLMIGLDGWNDKTTYELQTIKDNVQLFTPELLDRINEEVVRAGHTLVKKKTKQKNCL